MSACVQQLLESVEGIRRLIQKVKAQHVNTAEPKDAIRSLARRYFEDWRPNLIAVGVAEGDLLTVDQCIQELVRLAQARTHTSDYRSRLTSLKRVVGAVELKALIVKQRDVARSFQSHHQRILESLCLISLSAADSYEQGLLDIRSSERKSWRGTSVEFREALRETLDTLAPDEEVSTQPGFKLEPNTNGPTMKQKAVFILKARRRKDPQIKTFKDAIDLVEELIGKLVRSVYTRSSVAVHVAESESEARQVRDYVTVVLAELLEVRD